MPSERAEPSERARLRDGRLTTSEVRREARRQAKAERQSRPSERACDMVARRSAKSYEDRCGNCLLSDSSKAQTVGLLLSREAENTLLQNGNILRVMYADAEETSIRMLFKEVLKFFEFETGGPKLRMDSKSAKAMIPVEDGLDVLLQKTTRERCR